MISERAMRVGYVGFFVILAMLLSCVPMEAQSDYLKLNGKDDWQYILHEPAAPRDGLPLVMVLHGFAGDARSIARLWGLQQGLKDFYVLAPQAPVKMRMGKNISTWQGGMDDDFLLVLLDRVIEEKKIDPKRVAIAGYSSGAAAALRLAAKHKERFVACAAVGAGENFVDVGDGAAVKYFLLAGSRDPSFNEKKAQALAAKMRKKGVEVQYEIIPGADHASLYNKIAPVTRWLTTLLSESVK